MSKKWNCSRCTITKVYTNFLLHIYLILSLSHVILYILKKTSQFLFLKKCTDVHRKNIVSDLWSSCMTTFTNYWKE